MRSIGHKLGARRLTVGVEEEFLLLDPVTGAPLPVIDQVIPALNDETREQSRIEFHPSQLEMVTPVCTDLAELRGHLVTLRQAAAEASRAAGARLVAVGTTPVAAVSADVSDVPRYAAMVQRFGAIAGAAGLCGCHVHVGVPTRDMAIQISNHLRPWLPTLHAMTVNSPLHAGVDTGHDSWRTIRFGRWPSTGPAPYFTSVDDYDHAVKQLIAAGVLMDEAMVYWYTRPSTKYPTIEVRVGDVCPTVNDTVLVAGLVRGLVATAIADIHQGAPAPRIPDWLLAAAHWRAARYGLDGELVGPTGQVRPAWQLIDELLTKIRPALLRHGDLPRLERALCDLHRHGTGAARQRQIHQDTGDVHAVLTHLIEQTIASP
jgi:carboxylate-amine ligase